mgnify:CR=1 FL=1
MSLDKRLFEKQIRILQYFLWFHVRDIERWLKNQIVIENVSMMQKIKKLASQFEYAFISPALLLMFDFILYWEEISLNQNSFK